MLLSLVLACAHVPPGPTTPTATAAAAVAPAEVAAPPQPPLPPPPPPPPPESSLAPGSGCKAASSLPPWFLTPTGVGLPGTDIVFAPPAGFTIDPTRSGPAHVVLAAAMPGHPESLVELWILDVCTSYNAPAIGARIANESLAALAPPGVRPDAALTTISIGDGLLLTGDGTVGERTFPLWFRWIELLHSAEFTVAVAATCERVGRVPTCEAGVAKMVDSVRLQARPATPPATPAAASKTAPKK